MDNRPVGVFDSGLGGLTAVRAIREILPGQDLVYLGDTARVPYGPRGRDVIVQYTLEHMRFMLRRGVKALVVACGTMSAIGMDALRERSPVPVLGVVEPSAAEAAALSQNGRVGVICTAATAASGAYQARLKALRPDAQVTVLACPLLVPLVEAGRVRPGDTVIETVAAEYLAPLRDAGVDTLLLGCTHYPLLRDVISGFMGPGVALVDSGAAVAAALRKHLEDTGSLPAGAHAGLPAGPPAGLSANLSACPPAALSARPPVALSARPQADARFYVTDSTEQFTKLGSLFMQNTTFGVADRVDILKD